MTRETNYKKPLTFSREQQYSLVWSKPINVLAKNYEVSDNLLRKACIEMSIPLPINGYWQKLKYGKNSEPLELTLDYQGEPEVTFFSNEGGINQLHNAPLAILQREIENDRNLNLTVSSRLVSPVKLIIDAQDALVTRRSERYLQNGLIISRQNLDVRVAPDNVARALRFMDTLIKALQARGHTVELKDYETQAIVNGEKFEVTCREKTKRIVAKSGTWTEYTFQPIGILCFKVDGYLSKEWKDGKLLIEEQISNILAQLELSAQEWKEEKKKWQIEREKQQEIERIQKELLLKKEKEIESFKKLISQAKRWEQAKMIREFANAVENTKILGNPNAEEVQTWLDWARKKADWYDPIIKFKDDLLTNVDLENLTIKKAQSDIWNRFKNSLT